MRIPFFNLKKQYESLHADLDGLFGKIALNSTFVRGEEISAFERAFSHALDDDVHTIATACGTDALFIALKCLGVTTADEVITPAFSWISSSETISLCGGIPVFADIEPQTYTIDPEQIEKLITPKTKGVVVVHLFGQAANMKRICDICKEHDLFLIEDCAQAHLTRALDSFTGTFGDAAAFSFYPTKNLGAYGDAGCVVTKNGLLAERMRRFANHGALGKEDHLFEGLNSRMDTIQASILQIKLPFLQKWNEQRISHALLYNELLSGCADIITPRIRAGTAHTFHIYAIKCKKRDELQDFLRAKGIQTLIHYPLALPNLPAYSANKSRGRSFPVSDALQNEILSLPIYPELLEEEIRYVAETIRAFFQGLESVTR
jgi:dTDP-4-amino-4,6-dideoxygalactose transaminase